MGDQRVENLLERQRGVVAVWQLVAEHCSEGVIRQAVGRLRAVHSGVYVSGHGPPSDWQLWKAATLTAPGTYLADWSASSLLTMRDRADRMPTTAVRYGSGSTLVIPAKDGRLGSLKVRRARFLPNEVVEVDGIPSIGAPRTTLDLIARMRDLAAADRLMRDVLRKRLVTPIEFRACVAQHRGERGVGRLRVLVDLYGPLAIDRSKSDAEALGLLLLAAAGVPAPALNVYIAGGEADYAWFDDRHIVEVDGPQYHLFAQRDAAKQARWEQAGWTVDRVSSNDVYDHPHRLLAAAVPPHRRPSGSSLSP